jgi:hypothetical protein
MRRFKEICARYSNPVYVRALYLMLALVALVLAAGAPNAAGLP